MCQIWKMFIYISRIIHNSDMKIIEIHPGDGSILVSQGVKAHFYTHFLLIGDRVSLYKSLMT